MGQLPDKLHGSRRGRSSENHAAIIWKEITGDNEVMVSSAGTIERIKPGSIMALDRSLTANIVYQILIHRNHVYWYRQLTMANGDQHDKAESGVSFDQDKER